MGQAHARSYMPKMYEQIIKEEIDPTQIITHTLPLEKASHGYDIFNNKQDNCIKVVLKP
jgi:S-(hydroxymethyl)glutathione dehydrogenase/alcohol dehydrogenase